MRGEIMRATSIVLLCILLSSAAIAAAGSPIGARADSPDSVPQSAPPIRVLEIPSATFSEGFDDTSTLAGKGWIQTNNSQSPGTTGWFQGTVFDAHSGEPTSYVGANYNNAGSDPDSTISNWLLLPEMDFRNGDEFAFWTRTANELWPDRLELRLSINGPSLDVGSTATSTGDFDTRLLVVNEDLVPGE